MYYGSPVNYHHFYLPMYSLLNPNPNSLACNDYSYYLLDKLLDKYVVT
ncbi:hypothetical protein BTCBT_007331 [Bacillus thuringiensis T01-328]|jgi:hypothetical protein|uniref:Uncharacterized protein n=1 Tax=Bacillus thuringiensis T01-328 TaxID=1324966 RepID=A0AAN4HBI5_BACTU|nr:hypothetical protein BTCBT_007331 [Bacillus thuringiensis T01-328]